jgi:hypothetical protein
MVRILAASLGPDQTGRGEHVPITATRRKCERGTRAPARQDRGTHHVGAARRQLAAFASAAIAGAAVL